MITPEERAELIVFRIEQAEQAARDAQICREQKMYGLAVNRVYYGMFYAMLALGLVRKFETSKHQQMHGWFNKHFVHTGIFPRHFAQLVKKAFESRTKVDYQVNVAPTDADLDALFADMKFFISTIKAWLEANPA